MATFLYKQIKEYLIGLLRQNAQVTDYKLPSENQLAVKFNTTRITAKRALSELQEEGLIQRIHGKGSFATRQTAAEKPEPRKNRFVGMVLPNLNSHFITEIIDGAHDYFKQQDIELFISATNDTQEALENCISNMILSGTLGVIVFPVDNAMYSKDLLLLALNDYPVVFIDRTLKNIDVSSVTTDHFTAAKDATTLLIQKGCREIGFITPSPSRSTSIERRINGYKDALAQNGILLHFDNKCYIDEQKDDVCDRIAEFLQSHPNLTGLLSYGDVIGIGLYKALGKCNKKVPQDLKVIFFDDEYTNFHDILPFAPTCIKQDGHKIGFEAARIITEQYNKQATHNEKILLSSKLIERASTD